MAKRNRNNPKPAARPTDRRGEILLALFLAILAALALEVAKAAIWPGQHPNPIIDVRPHDALHHVDIILASCGRGQSHTPTNISS